MSTSKLVWRRWTIAASCGLLMLSFAATVAQSAEDADKTEKTPTTPQAQTEKIDPAKWLDSLAAGYQQAQSKRLPIIVRIGGASCSLCLQLQQEITKPEVQQELKRWTPVYIDVEETPAGARLMAVGPIPALRLLTSQGKVVASRDGMMTAAEFVKWLQENRESAVASIAPELTSTGPPSIVDVVRLIRQFQNRDATVREAALRRLSPFPHTSAVAVVSAMTEGNLSTRLAALELLQQWKAPASELDPWQPKTITDERIDLLSAWASSLPADEKPVEGHAAESTQFPEEKLRVAREMIDKMIVADASQSRGIRERLARFGDVLLPDVYQRLITAETDNARRRLTALRYRLVAADELVLNWPGGLESLAATDEATRLAAADELSRRATERDQALLLELFSDPAPLIREISLRTLQKAGGHRTQATLIRLLDDPEPNVRAAVLKQLTEGASRNLVPHIAKYVKGETNADLVVHAVRFLREAGGNEAIACLKTLIVDASWQVRAEAVEAIGDIANNERGINTAEKATSYRVLIEALSDEDAFVVSRAIDGLDEIQLASAVESMIQVASRHPELAGKVIVTLTKNSEQKVLVIPHLRKFSNHEQPQVRAAAIAGLVTLESDLVGDELMLALKDSDRAVRIAAGNALFRFLDRRRKLDAYGNDFFDTVFSEVVDEPQPSFLGALFSGLFSGRGDKQSPEAETNIESKPAEKELTKPVEKRDEVSPREETTNTETDVDGAKSDLQERIDEVDSEVEVVEVGGERISAEDTPSDPDAKLKEIRAGKRLPDWAFLLADPLLPMLQGESVEERLAAALPLSALGRDQEVIPVLRDIATAQPVHASKVAAALPWLLWENRQDLFNTLAHITTDTSQLQTMASTISQTRDDRNAELLWSLINHEAASAEILSAVEYSIRDIYFPNHSYDPTSAPLRRRKFAIETVMPRAKSGTRWQRVMALALLMPIARDDIEALARTIVDAPDTEPGFRADAFQIILLTQSNNDSRQAAIAALSDANPDIQKLAIKLLAFGKGSLAALFDNSLSLTNGMSFSTSRDNGTTVEIEAPESLTAEHIKPLLVADDPELAAGAAYLLVLLDDGEAIDRLIEIWNQLPPDKSQSTRRLVYRAISFTDDEAHFQILESIFKKIQAEDNDEIREFYWTVRGMTGPKVLGLRKRIRDQVGMENLR